MIKHYLTIILLLLFCHTQAQIVEIPDPVFKYICINYPVIDTDGDGLPDAVADINNDGEIQVSEAEVALGLMVAAVEVGGESIHNMEGVQSFINIEVLECHQQQITSMSLITLSNLKELICSTNNLSSLDVTQNPNLEILKCGGNDIIGTIDVTQNPNLVYFGVGGNQLTSIDVTQNPNLETLIFSSNEITTIDITQNPLLEELAFATTQISTVDTSQNLELHTLNVSSNQLTDLDISQNYNLEILFCGENQLSEIDFTQNPLLRILICFDNPLLTSLDISQHPNIASLHCNDNQLTSLILNNGNNINLKHLDAQNNPNLTCIQVDDETYSNSQICNNAQYESWCKDESAVYSEDCNLGTEEVLETGITIYPNPVQEILYIENNSSFSINAIQVYDILGRLVLQENNNFNQLDVSGLTSGLLFVQIETDEGVLVKKIIKE